MEIFNVIGTMTEERRIDETLSRTASVLHTFASIMVNCTNWTEQCLFSFLKLIYLKNIGKVYITFVDFNIKINNILEYVDRVIKLINKHYFNNQDINIMEKYLEIIIEKWTNEGLIFDNFPFKLFGCKDKLEFYIKYLDVCVPYLISVDNNQLNDIAKQLNMSDKEIIRVSWISPYYNLRTIF